MLAVSSQRLYLPYKLKHVGLSGIVCLASLHFSMVHYLSQILVTSIYYFAILLFRWQLTGQLYTVNQFIETADKKSKL